MSKQIEMYDPPKEGDNRGSIQRIRKAASVLSRARLTLGNRQEALRRLEVTLHRAERNGKGVDVIRRKCARKLHDIQESEGKIATAEEVIYADPTAPKKPLDNEGQLKLRRALGGLKSG